MTFREFLQEKAAEEHQPERRQRREEWIAAVTQLMRDIRAWLAESDPDGILDVVPITVQVAEPALGYYDAPALKIGVGNHRAVHVQPVGRDALGLVGRHLETGVRAEGRVDVTRGVDKYILYRVFQDGQPRWYALDAYFKATPLDRTRLEEILQDLLS
jgi:hypothetical protein